MHATTWQGVADDLIVGPVVRVTMKRPNAATLAMNMSMMTDNRLDD